MTKDKKQAGEAFAREARAELSGLENLKGFELYKFWRDGIFSVIRRKIETNKKSATASGNLFDLDIEKEIGPLIDCGFFHQAYTDNLRLSIEIIASNFNSQEKISELLAVIDSYIRPKTTKTEGVEETIKKALSGMLAFILIRENACSKRLAIHISKSAFKFRSEKTVYDALKLFKVHFRTKSEIPNLMYVFLFGLIFYSSVDWQSIKPRAKHTRSTKELESALLNYRIFCLRLIHKNIIKARKALKNNSSPLSNLISPELKKHLIKTSFTEDNINDEVVLGVTFSSFFSDKEYLID
jgi:hypothetical protein